MTDLRPARLHFGPVFSLAIALLARSRAADRSAGRPVSTTASTTAPATNFVTRTGATAAPAPEDGNVAYRYGVHLRVHVGRGHPRAGCVVPCRGRVQQLLLHGGTGTSPAPWWRCSGGCTYDGLPYMPGDSFPASDGCNTCTCDPSGSGSVGCTEIACHGCERDGIGYAAGAPVPPATAATAARATRTAKSCARTWLARRAARMEAWSTCRATASRPRRLQHLHVRRGWRRRMHGEGLSGGLHLRRCGPQAGRQLPLPRRLQHLHLHSRRGRGVHRALLRVRPVERVVAPVREHQPGGVRGHRLRLHRRPDLRLQRVRVRLRAGPELPALVQLHATSGVRCGRDREALPVLHDRTSERKHRARPTAARIVEIGKRRRAGRVMARRGAERAKNAPRRSQEARHGVSQDRPIHAHGGRGVRQHLVAAHRQRARRGAAMMSCVLAA